MKSYELKAPPGPGPIETILATACEGMRDALDGDPWVACGSFGEAARLVDQLLSAETQRQGEGHTTVPKPASINECAKLFTAAIPSIAEAIRWQLSGQEKAARRLMAGKAPLFRAIERCLEEMPMEESHSRYRG